MVPPGMVPTTGGMVPPGMVPPGMVPPGMVPQPVAITPQVPSRSPQPVALAPSAPFTENRVTSVITFKNSDGASINVRNVFKPDGTGYRYIDTPNGTKSKGPFFTYTVQGQKIYITYTGNDKRVVSTREPVVGSEPV
jgi:hypothetical protein